jgi:hypothetical protein
MTISAKRYYSLYEVDENVFIPDLVFRKQACRMQSYKTKDETITVSNIDYLIHSLKYRKHYYDHDQIAEGIGITSAA